MYTDKNICVIIPALNEALSIARVIDELFALSVCQHGNRTAADELSTLHHRLSDDNDFMADKVVVTPACDQGCQSAVHRLVDAIVVCDNGSTDQTAAIAESCGAMVVYEAEKGYGAACLAALAAMPEQTDIIVFVDADYSVDAEELPALIHTIVDGADLVVGSRTLGYCEKGALSLPQCYGNALASVMISAFWKAKVTDLGPFRAITRQALNDINMQDRQFGWTVEMQIRALQLSQTMVEIPVTTRVRIGKSKIGGTVKGVVGASRGILGTIFKLYWRHRVDSFKSPMTSVDVKPVSVRSTSDVFTD